VELLGMTISAGCSSSDKWRVPQHALGVPPRLMGAGTFPAMQQAVMGRFPFLPV